MFDHANLIDLIERSIDDDPFCSVCHASMTIRDRGGRLWLESDEGTVFWVSLPLTGGR